MTHARQIIREELVAALEARPALSGRVFASRAYAVQTTPAVLVYTLNEESAPAAMGGLLQREMTVAIEVYTKRASDDWDAQIDTAAVEIEKAMAAGTFSVVSIDPAGLSVTVSAGDRPSGSARLDYRVIYSTTESDPETPL